MTKKIYKTMQGRVIDMETIMAKNETMPAVGNARMNARGDELGAGGKVIKTREDSVAAYYEDNPNAIPKEGVKKSEVSKVTQSKEETKKTEKEGKKKQ